ncbi:hypothetical protein JCM9533A_58470 [Catenuloplanes niger JCM 9533]
MSPTFLARSSAMDRWSRVRGPHLHSILPQDTCAYARNRPECGAPWAAAERRGLGQCEVATERSAGALRE